jgi:hypothetical protein
MKLARWKSPRPTKHFQKNPEDHIRDATAGAFQAATDAEAVASLCELHGVKVRTATALLHWMVPDRFPILEVHVVAALREPEPRSWEDLSYYARIADRCRRLADDPISTCGPSIARSGLGIRNGAKASLEHSATWSRPTVDRLRSQ